VRASADAGEMGPPIRVRLAALDDAALTSLIRDGRPLKGMPGNALPAAEMSGLQRFLRTLERAGPPVVRTTVRMTDGRRLEGQVLGELESSQGRWRELIRTRRCLVVLDEVSR
jgi:hypothetical protein